MMLHLYWSGSPMLTNRLKKNADLSTTQINCSLCSLYFLKSQHTLLSAVVLHIAL